MSSTTSDCSDKTLGALLFRFEMGTLAETDRDRFEEHLMDCSYCRQAFEEMQPVSAALRRHKLSLVRELHREGLSFDSLRRELRSEIRQSHQAASFKNLLNSILESLTRPRIWAPVAISAVCLFFVVLMQRHSTENPYLSMLTFEKSPYESLTTRSIESRQAEEIFSQGMQAYLKNDYSKAISKLKKAVELEPGNGRWWMFLGISEYMDRRALDAVSALSRADSLTEFDLNIETRWYLAQAHLLAKQEHQAIPILQGLVSQPNLHSVQAKILLDKLNRMNRQD
jgi:tetratricopeptide (TPR) repeat protein